MQQQIPQWNLQLDQKYGCWIVLKNAEIEIAIPSEYVKFVISHCSDFSMPYEPPREFCFLLITTKSLEEVQWKPHLSQPYEFIVGEADCLPGILFKITPCD